MSQQDREDIKKALLQKGFFLSEGDHEFYYYTHNTSIYTKISHGSKYKVYDNKLLGKIKRQLKLDSMNDLINFIKCPLSSEMYYNILRQKQLI